MELLTISNVCWLFFQLGDMIDADGFRISSVVEIIQE